MRTVSGSEIESANPASAADLVNRRFVAVQASEPALLLQKLSAAVAAIAAESEDEWEIVFFDVAGSGSGRNFTALVEMATDAGFAAVVGLDVAADGGLGITPAWMASITEALSVADGTAELAAAAAAPDGLILVMDAFAGASKGPEFLGTFLTAED